MKKVFLAVNLVFALLLMAFFVNLLDLSPLVKTLEKADLGIALAAALLYACVQLVNFLRIARIIGDYSPSVLLAHFAGVAASDYTPGRSGYSLAFYAMKKIGVPFSKSLKATGVIFATDFASRALAALALVAVFSPSFLPIALAMVLASCILFASFFRKSKRASWAFSRLPFIGKKASLFYDSVLKNRVSPMEIAISFLLSVLGALFRGAAWALVFYAIGVKIDLPWLFFSLTLFSSVLTAISIIPVSLAGIGVQEATGAVVLSAFLGLSVSTAGVGLILARAMELSTDLVLAAPWFVNNFKG